MLTYNSSTSQYMVYGGLLLAPPIPADEGRGRWLNGTVETVGGLALLLRLR